MSSATRRETVLILSGTGTNAWHHYGFLRQFSIKEFNEFRAILGVSGGACVFFARIMSELGYFGDNRIADYDVIWRRRLNHYGTGEKLVRAFKGEFLFRTEDLHHAMGELFSDGTAIKFDQFPVKNFKCVTYRDDRNELFIADAASAPNLSVALVTASGGFPRRIGKLNLCEQKLIGGISISDFDFAPKPFKEDFKKYVNRNFSDNHLAYLSLFRSGSKGNLHWVKTGRDRFPRLYQIVDAALMATGIPNPRHDESFGAENSGVAGVLPPHRIGRRSPSERSACRL